MPHQLSVIELLKDNGILQRTLLGLAWNNIAIKKTNKTF